MALTKKQYYHLLRLLTGSLAAQVDLLMIEKQLPFSPVFTPVLFIYFLHERHYPEAVMILLFSIPLALIYHHTWGLQFFLYLTVVLFYLAFKNSIRIKKATPRLLLFSFILLQQMYCFFFTHQPLKTTHFLIYLLCSLTLQHLMLYKITTKKETC
jgi:hypothetical protein